LKIARQFIAGKWFGSRIIPESSDRDETLADHLTDHIGVLSSSEYVSGGAQMSKNCSKKFAAGLLKSDSRDGYDTYRYGIFGCAIVSARRSRRLSLSGRTLEDEHTKTSDDIGLSVRRRDSGSLRMFCDCGKMLGVTQSRSFIHIALSSHKPEARQTVSSALRRV
jgi:hypothetical protein